MDNVPSCPFCPFSDADSYFVVQHVELCHSETGHSPFVVKDDDGTPDTLGTFAQDEAGVTGATSDDEYIDCECGECVLLAEFDSHVEMHIAEGAVASEEGGQSALGSTAVSHSSDNISVYKMPKDSSYSSIDICYAYPEVNAARLDCILARTPSSPTSTQKRPQSDRNGEGYRFSSRSPVPGVASNRVRHQTARRLGV